MLESEVQPAMMKLYTDGDLIFQDVQANVHKTEQVMNKAAGMASHTADGYPIENFWSILKDEKYLKRHM